VTLQTIKGGLVPLGLIEQFALALSNARLDASGEKLHAIFAPPITGNIDRVGFRVAAVTASETVRAGLYTVSLTTGLPTTTGYGGMAVGTVTPTANTFHEVTLATPATADPDDVIALGVEFDSAIGNVDFSMQAANSGFPYVVHNGSKSAGTMPLCAVRYDDGVWYPISQSLQIQTIDSAAFANNSTPDERALKFRQPFPSRLCGVELLLTASAGADFDLVLDGGAFSSVVLRAHDGDVFGSGGAGRVYSFPIKTKRDLAANTDYYISLRPSTTTSITLREFSFGSAGMLDSLWGGQTACLSTRVNGGAWTDTTTTRPGIRPVFDQFDDGAGGVGGGGIIGVIGE
jgi:hypothetical protein